MKIGAAALPPLHEVDAALRKTTEILARELALPTNEPPGWTGFEWHIARAVIAMQGVSALLYGGLCWQGPDSWRRFLHEQWIQSVARHQMIACLLDAIDSRARSAGVAFVALKGAALYAGKFYAAGERPMGDIDLLIRDEDAKSLARVLGDCAYDASFSTHRHQVFQRRDGKAWHGLRLGEHVDSPINIEVHTRIAEFLPVAEVDITAFVLPGETHAGINAYPSAASLMLHLLLHAAGNMRARALRLVQLHDIALLAARFTPSDWQELLAMCPNGDNIWWAAAPLLLAGRYYSRTVPSGLMAQVDAKSPRLLLKVTQRQRLADVSWSNVRIEAFPGMEWCRTPQEALKFMSSRIWPSRADRLELELGAAQIPGAATIPWYGSSHAARILRWVFSRPPRVQTMLSVRAALAQQP